MDRVLPKESLWEKLAVSLSIIIFKKKVVVNHNDFFNFGENRLS